MEAPPKRPPRPPRSATPTALATAEERESLSADWSPRPQADERFAWPWRPFAWRPCGANSGDTRAEESKPSSDPWLQPRVLGFLAFWVFAVIFWSALRDSDAVGSPGLDECVPGKISKHLHCVTDTKKSFADTLAAVGAKKDHPNYLARGHPDAEGGSYEDEARDSLGATGESRSDADGEPQGAKPVPAASTRQQQTTATRVADSSAQRQRTGRRRRLLRKPAKG